MLFLHLEKPSLLRDIDKGTEGPTWAWNTSMSESKEEHTETIRPHPRDTRARMKGLPIWEPGTIQTSKHIKVVDRRIKRMWYIYIMEYYSAIKNNKILPFAAIWVDLKGIMLSKTSQRNKDKYWEISLICGIWKLYQTGKCNPKKRSKLTDREKKLVVTGRERKEGGATKG